MATRKNDILLALESYLARNNREQEIPKGFKSREELIKMFGMKEGSWDRLHRGLIKAKKIQSIWLRRAKGGRCFRKCFYKIDEAFIKELSKGV
jgi:hypothetical protein